MTTDNKDNEFSIGSSDYAEMLRHAVAVIEHARTEIARHVNGYVSTAYWEIGQMLHERKIESGYGDNIVKRLSADLKERYPKMGVSPRQLWNMKKFYERYAEHGEKLLRSVALLPWSHNLLLLNKGLDDNATLYYAQETVAKGWNRDLLLNAIKLNMYETQALARVDNNFDRTLPAEQAKYANEVFSSSYNLGFLGVTSPILELELEDRLVDSGAVTIDIDFIDKLGENFSYFSTATGLYHVGCNADALVHYLSTKQIYVGLAHSACSDDADYRVVKALGVPVEYAERCIRVSFSEDSTFNDIDALVNGIKEFKEKFV